MALCFNKFLTKDIVQNTKQVKIFSLNGYYLEQFENLMCGQVTNDFNDSITLHYSDFLVKIKIVERRDKNVDER